MPVDDLFLNIGQGQCVDAMSPASQNSCEQGSYGGCAFNAYCCSYTDEKTNTREKCANACVADSNCVAYAWKSSYDHCYLFNAAVLSNTSNIVGVRTLDQTVGHTDATCYKRIGIPRDSLVFTCSFLVLHLCHHHPASLSLYSH